MDKPVSILIPTRFNNRYLLELCILTIKKYTEQPYEIIVGNAGADKEALEYLKNQTGVKTISCPDSIRPKDYLARNVSTPYFLFLHDDAQILKAGWLKRRVDLMEKNKNTGIVGVLSTNYKYGLNKFLPHSVIEKRLFPFAMLVRKSTQDELDLFWGIVKGFDTGGLAYLQFIKQKKWKFVSCRFDKEIRHWGQMTWVIKERTKEELRLLNYSFLKEERDRKLSLIRNLIKSGNY